MSVQSGAFKDSNGDEITLYTGQVTVGELMRQILDIKVTPTISGVIFMIKLSGLVVLQPRVSLPLPLQIRLKHNPEI